MAYRPLAAFMALLLCHVSSVQAEERISMNALAVESKSGKNLGSSSSKSRMAGLFRAQKRLVKHLLTQVGILPERLPADVLAELERPQTTNFDAFMAFSAGLDQLDQGRFVKAKAFFTEAANFDPGFQLAMALQAAMPDKPTSVEDAISHAKAAGRQKARAILKKIARKKAQKGKGKTRSVVSEEEDTDSGLGSANREESDFVSKASNLERGPSYGMRSALRRANEAGAVLQKMHDSAQMPAPQAVYSSSPVCAGGLCGFYAAILDERGHLEQELSGEEGSSYWSKLLIPSYMTEKGVSLKMGETLTIAQLGGGGYLTNDASPALANIKGFKEGSTGASAASSTEPIALNGTVENDGESGYPTVAAGYYDTCANDTLSCYEGAEANLAGFYYDEDHLKGISSGTYKYGLFGRLFFAEGVVTPEADLNELARNNTTYAYTGVAGGMLSIRQNGGYSMGGQVAGNFSTDLNFSTGKVTHFNTEVSSQKVFGGYFFGETDENVQIQIQADSADLNADGSFQIRPDSPGTTFQITAPALSTTPIPVEQGLASGRTFGAQAVAVGGVFAGQTARITRPPTLKSEIHRTGPFELSTHGFFAGSRPVAVGETTGSTP